MADLRSSCFSREELEQFASGSSGDAWGEAAGPLSGHLSECARCRNAFESIRRDNALLSEFVPGAATSLKAVLRTPTTPAIPGYRIVGEVHRGGQGVVYEAEQLSTHRRVAVKVMREGPLADAHERARFDREVRVLAQLKHPHIVTIHDSGEAGGLNYIVMDYVDGSPLDEYVSGKVEKSKNQKVETEELLRLFAEIAEAVNAAHLIGVIHRDLKPSNILVVDVGAVSGRDSIAVPHASRSETAPKAQPMVLDFGLARLAEGDSIQNLKSKIPNLTMTGQFVGSLPYASPEQAEGAHDRIDVRTDVYSLGVICYRMLTGRFPYDVSGSLPDVLNNIRFVEPAPLRGNLNKRTRRNQRTGEVLGSASLPSLPAVQVDDEVETIVLKCLQKDAARRYQTAGELARDLRHYLAGEPIQAKRDSAGYVLRKTLRRYRLAAVIATGFMLLIAMAAIISTVLWRAAEVQRKLAIQRAKETQQIADLQAEQLSGIDVPMMGIRLRADLLSKVRATAERSGRTPEEIDARITEIERLIAGTDFTGLALHALEENIFQRALTAVGSFADQPLVKARLLQTLASTSRELGLLDVATEPQEEALAIRRNLLGDGHSDTLTSISELGNLLYSKGNFGDAEPYYREALEGRHRMLSDEHPSTLDSLSNMGAVYWAQGKLAEAEPFWRAALESARRALGNEHPDTLTALHNVGFLLHAQGELTGAEPYHREALEGRRRVLGSDHPDTLDAMINMGFLSHSQGKLAEAELYHREALEACRRVYGDDHSDTLIAINWVGYLLEEQNRLAEAESYTREAFESRRRVLGDDHPHTLGSIINLGTLLWAQGRPAEAVTLLVPAEPAVRRESTGSNQFRLGRFLTTLGRSQSATGMFDLAEASLTEAYAILSTVDSPTPKDQCDALIGMVELYETWDAAEPGAGHREKAAEFRADLPVANWRIEPG